MPFARRQQTDQYRQAGEKPRPQHQRTNRHDSQTNAEDRTHDPFHAETDRTIARSMVWMAHDHATASESSAPKRRSRAANFSSAADNTARSKSGQSVSRNSNSA